MEITSFLLGYKAGMGKGGGSSGGGSLPAGLYWEQDGAVPPYNYAHQHFVRDGKLYLLTRISSTSSGSTQTRYVYEYSESGYTKIAEFTDTKDVSVTGTVLWFNGKLHVIADTGTSHITWNETDGFKESTALPKSAQGKAVIWNGEMYISTSDKNIYKWNENDNTWELYATMTLPKYAASLIVHDNSLYAMVVSIFTAPALYKIVDGTDTLVREFAPTYNGGASNLMLSFNGCIYFVQLTAKNTTYGILKVCRYDVDNDVLTELGYSPYTGSSCHAIVFDNELRWSGGDGTYKLNVIMHEVEAGEI